MNCNEKIPQAPQYIKDFEQLGFGMFVHLGLYSKLNRGEWVYHINNLDKAEYQNLKNSFNLGSMKQIVDVAKSAGCKYIVLTTRHHDGFSLYDTRGLNDYDIMHTPSGRDVIAVFASECRKAGANFLLNIGPNADGSVSTMQRGIMECIGRWMDSFGEAIYNGRPYISYDDKPEFFLKHENDHNVLYLFRFNPQQCYGDKNVTLDFSEDSPKLPLFDKFNREVISASWLDNGEQLSFIQDGDKLKINFTAFPYGQSLCVRVAKVLLKSE